MFSLSDCKNRLLTDCLGILDLLVTIHLKMVVLAGVARQIAFVTSERTITELGSGFAIPIPIADNRAQMIAIVLLARLVLAVTIVIALEEALVLTTPDAQVRCRKGICSMFGASSWILLLGRT
jgi:hypothetical protein